MGPLDVILNKGFAVSQFNNRDRYIFSHTYASAHVWNSIARFSESLDRYGGWRVFLGDEVIPTSLDGRSGKWAPNYGGHLVEGGITYRRLAEWHRAHGVPAPRLTAAVVTMASAVINEMYSHPNIEAGSVATAADLLFFDPLGIVLFSFDPVAHFFAGTLQATIWSSQAALMPDGELVNNGNNIVAKLPLSPWDETSIFIRGGLALTPGITFHRPDGIDVSVAFGGEARIQRIDPVTGEERPTIGWGAGVFVDRGGSLLWSVMASQAEHRRFVLNVYPGVFEPLPRRMGAWLLVRQSGAIRLGVSWTGALGLGVGAGVGR
jgi:hypothetical protein